MTIINECMAHCDSVGVKERTAGNGLPSAADLDAAAADTRAAEATSGNVAVDNNAVADPAGEAKVTTLECQIADMDPAERPPCKDEATEVFSVVLFGRALVEAHLCLAHFREVGSGALRMSHRTTSRIVRPDGLVQA